MAIIRKTSTIKTHEPKLNDKQLHILELAYIYRYLTTDNLSLFKQITHNSAYSALSILTKRGYLGRKHNKSYHLQNKSARYYLTPKAVKLLKTLADERELDVDILDTRRYEDRKTSNFIDLQVAIMTAMMDIFFSVDDGLDISTATSMKGQEPDNYLRPYPSLEIYNKDTDYHCLIEILPDDQHLFIAKKRIRKYIEHYDNHNWEWDKYPDIYLVRQSVSDRKRLEAYIAEKMEDAYLDEDDFRIYVVKQAGSFLN